MQKINFFFRQFKEKLKKIKVLSNINGFLKSKLLVWKLNRLKRFYISKSKSYNIAYDENATLERFTIDLRKKTNNSFPKKYGELRIFWIGANYDQDNTGFLQALKKTGNVTEFINWKGTYGQWYWNENGEVEVYNDRIRKKNDDCLIPQVYKTSENGGIDLVMGQTWANYISVEAIKTIRKLGIPFINISMDDRLPDNWKTHNSVRLGAVGLAEVSDLVLTTCKDVCLWYEVEKCNALFWPLASDPGTFYSPFDSTRDIDVLFIGNKYGIRQKIIDELKTHGVNVECYGSGWENGYVDASQAANLSKRSKIILGVGTVGYCRDVYTLKLRDFDAVISGALYITHRNPDLLNIFVEGVEIECYETTDECAKKILYYLKDKNRRLAISSCGQNKAINKNVWDSHLHNTFKKLNIIV